MQTTPDAFDFAQAPGGIVQTLGISAQALGGVVQASGSSARMFYKTSFSSTRWLSEVETTGRRERSRNHRPQGAQSKPPAAGRVVETTGNRHRDHSGTGNLYQSCFTAPNP